MPNLGPIAGTSGEKHFQNIPSNLNDIINTFPADLTSNLQLNKQNLIDSMSTIKTETPDDSPHDCADGYAKYLQNVQGMLKNSSSPATHDAYFDSLQLQGTLHDDTVKDALVQNRTALLAKMTLDEKLVMLHGPPTGPCCQCNCMA